MQRLAAIAPTLKETELRVLLHLMMLAETTDQHQIRISSRDLARQVRAHRGTIQAALDALTTRGLITTRQGTATRPSAHQVNVFSTAIMPAQGGTNFEPPQQELVLHAGSDFVPPAADSGTNFEPPALTMNAGAGAHVDLIDQIDLIDRLLKAKPSDFEADTIAAATRWLGGYQAKFGREPNAHPPEPAIVAQFLAVAPWPRLERMLYDLMAERKEAGYSPAWFVAVALQRIHGVQPAALKARRAELRVIRRRPDTPAATERNTADIDAAIAELIKRKSL